MQAIVDLDVNEAETWEMSLAFWENSDKTEPVDTSTWTYNGTFSFYKLCIPMAFTKIANAVTCRIEASELVDLPKAGSYTIEVNDTVNTVRLQQGRLVVDRETVCS